MRRTIPLLTLTAVAGFAVVGLAAGVASAQDKSDEAGTLEKLDRSIQALVEKASPAVVRLDVERTLSLKVVAGTDVEKKRLEDALNRFAPVESITATGFLVDGEGYVITTAAAVGPRATRVKASFAGGAKRIGRFMGADGIAGVALVKVEPVDGVEPLHLVDKCPRVGSITVLLGHAGKRDPVVRWGLLSGTARAIGDYDAYVLSSVDVRPGDAGGPLLDVKGRVIGMAVVSGSQNTPVQRLAEYVNQVRRPEERALTSTFIPSKQLKRIVEELQTLGRVRRGMLGVLLEDADTRAMKMGTGKYAGPIGRNQAVVEEAPEGLPAADAGIERGDEIAAIDGSKVTNRRSMVSWIQRRAPYTRVIITLRSPDGEERDVEVILGELPSPPPPPAALFNGLGVRGEKAGLRVYTVDAGSPASQVDIRPGDIIVAIAGESVKSEKDYVSIATGPAANLREVVLRILRNGEERTVTLK